MSVQQLEFGNEELATSTMPWPVEELQGRSLFARLLQHTPRQVWLVMTADVIGLMTPALFATRGRFWLLAVTVLSVLFLQSGGLYRSLLHLSVFDELPALVTRTMSAALTVTAVLLMTGSQSVLGSFLTLVAAGVVCQLALRRLGYRVVCLARAQRHVAHNTIIVGGGVIGAQIAQTLLDEPSYGLHVVGYVDDDPLLDEDEHVAAYLGKVGQLRNVLAAHSATVLIVAFSSTSESDLVDVVRDSDVEGREVFVVPRLFEVHGQPGHADHIGALPVVRLPRLRLNPTGRMVKRIFDLTVSGLALAVLSPFLLLIALAVRLETGPGVLFRQERVGHDGKLFELLKFRTLRPANETESATRWNVANDDRIGPVGRFLRRTSIDELPQLWNIVRGDMTVVGPRPERPYFVERFSNELPQYEHRHRMPAGLTGLAQVSGLRGDTSIADRARYDNYYIENWSLWLDVKIILGTIREVVGARGR